LKEATGLTAKYYAGKKFKSKEELLREVRKYNTRYNNISRKVLGFRSPNKVLKEYNENQQVKSHIKKETFFLIYFCNKCLTSIQNTLKKFQKSS